MLTINQGGLGRPNCEGFTRRSALKAGTLGAFGFSTADLLKLQAAGKTNGITNKSVILIWLQGASPPGPFAAAGVPASLTEVPW